MSVFVFPSRAHVIPESAFSNISAIGFERWVDIATACTDTDPQKSQLMMAALDVAECHKLMNAIFGNSPFLSHAMLCEPDTVLSVFQNGPTVSFSKACEEVNISCYEETDRTKLMRGLRIFKRRAALIIAMGDVAEELPHETLVHMISITAETGLQLAIRHLIRPLCPTGGVPEDHAGYFVLAMGKLGAQELNYSSDVDLIALYDADKAIAVGIADPRKAFIKLTRDLVEIFDARTADGYVFRTDLRLRPDPGSTPVAMSTEAAEVYYEGFGQNWERAAMIKARPVAGDITAGNEFLKVLRPFVWRKSLDYNAIQDIHSIKRQINAHRGGHSMDVLGHNVKLGRGGIREIEFFAQTQQLIWGGREPLLRNNQTLKILDVLCRVGLVAPTIQKEMHESYVYLRRVEHRLQMINDEQTQTLPKQEEKLEHLAIFLGHQDAATFSEVLLMHLKRVEQHYTGLFPDEADLGVFEGNLVFTGQEDDPETLLTLESLGFADPKFVSQAVRTWHAGRYRSTRSTQSRRLLTELMPVVLRSLGQSSKPDEAVRKFDSFLSRLPAGIQLFSMFQAHPQILNDLTELLGDSPKLSHALSENPNLLDNLLSPEFFEPLPPVADVVSELALRLKQAIDFEDSLNIARRFVKDRSFQIGVQVIRSLISARTAGENFASLAEAVLQGLLPVVVEEFALKHGRLPGGELVVLALGRLGAEDMTPTSDLDLILIYDAPMDAQSDGKRSLGTTTYYARLVQRLINALTAPTAEGALYEVDMRLRPSGNAGPLAVSFEAFAKYQKESAWTWEHQALTRAKVVAGPSGLSKRVAEVVHQTLTSPRDMDKMLLDVADMRARIRQTYEGRAPWEVKHRKGGLIDMDFIGQYLQLRYAPTHPQILRSRIEEVLLAAKDAGVLDKSIVEALLKARAFLNTVQLLLRLTVTEDVVDPILPYGLQQKLCRAVGVVDFDALKQQMDMMTNVTAEIFADLIENPAQDLRNQKEIS